MKEEGKERKKERKKKREKKEGGGGKEAKLTHHTRIEATGPTLLNKS